MSGESLLAADGARRAYGDRAVLGGVSLGVAAGEVLAVLGPNGAGKTTLFRLLLLLERPDGGRILHRGRPVHPGDRRAARRLAGVFQRPHLFSGSVRHNVEFGLRARGLSRGESAARAAAALERVGLGGWQGVPAATLSGGEAQRVALARALVLEPEVLLLDEPTANLDMTVRRAFREDLERLVRTGSGAAVVITHDPADAFSLADRVAVLESGRITQLGTPEELALAPATPFVAALTGAELILDGVLVWRVEELVEVTVGAGTRVLGTAATGFRAEPGAPVHVAYRPEDVVLLAPGSDQLSSARNCLPCRVAVMSPAGGLVRIRLDAPGMALVALITRGSAERLDLRRGAEAEAHIKATALRVYGAAQ
jgi:tungstate transport system ATP-binding protein